ncbi:hypothetical protein KAFR_0D00580 [Kazachstania africana CBS 2517]|uniref:Swi6 N-terminal domain-containing protein n=1 Tax=Kazachstania africana (strain ATCC 22294 / BCRC 22015 / CBS 2517 / CECT 1963 / NBRC 1671 / NRRL Y-8276) TaxID=1071382 RepID=H2ATK5_KAZAF|nr:hypothetical protein KAFR_0D00580 [Kazachstania africana CBS 2517]CCF57705.1 hypothetical protein KAFR_0D00580 [Kazachstania africana CBS 2517]
MPITEVTSYIFSNDTDVTCPLTLRKNDETGYFQLNSFLPLLKQLHENKTTDSINTDQLIEDTNTVGAISAELQDLLLSKYGVLVDTDSDGNKWITQDKAFQLLDMFSILHLFKDKFDTKKRTSNDQNTLGSPLKRFKNNNHTISVFDHDLSTVTEPIQIMDTLEATTAPGNDERVKLEVFLQKLLFPNVETSDGNDNKINNDGLPQPSFETTLQEVNMAYPHVALNLDIPVDEHNNTPLHWLTSIANIDLIKQLVKIGANRLIGDNQGESSLVKSVKSVNNYDSGTFEELLDYLYPCIILKDRLDRTILHHIVITSGMNGCSAAAKYYLDILMGWIVKKQNRPIDGNSMDPILKNIDLKWIILNMLNYQDSNGDTCLNIAARLGNVAIVDALLDYGADPYIANKSGLRPTDFGAGTSKLQQKLNNNIDNNISMTSSINDEQNTNQEANVDDDELDGKLDNLMKKPDTMTLIDDIKSLLATVSQDYDTEVQQHNEKLKSLRKELSSKRLELNESRKQLTYVKNLRDEYNLLKEQLSNLESGIAEEENNFKQESEKLGISSDETTGIDWDSSEFDADEPFKIDFVYDFLENKVSNEYDGDIDKLLLKESIDSLASQIRSSVEPSNGDSKETIAVDNRGAEDDIASNRSKLEAMLPPTVLLRARINAYKKNDEHLQNMLGEIKDKQSNLENKFRRVLSLCLKIDEEKVDDMLDGLLQAISSEDPQDIDTDEMQDFLRKHAV